MTEDEMVVWHHRLNGHEFEQAPGVGDGQGALVCYSPWDPKELDMTEELNGGTTEINVVFYGTHFKVENTNFSNICIFEKYRTHYITVITHLALILPYFKL